MTFLVWDKSEPDSVETIDARTAERAAETFADSHWGEYGYGSHIGIMVRGDRDHPRTAREYRVVVTMRPRFDAFEVNQGVRKCRA